MSDRTDANPQNGQGSGGGVQGTNGQNPTSEANRDSKGQGSQNGSNANSQNGQGSGEIDITNHPAFKALATKLDNVLSDNAKYRQRLRSFLSDDEGGQGNGNGSGNTNGASNEAAQMLQELREERALNRLSAAATRAGFRTPDLVLNFVKLSEVADEKGNVANPDAVIADLKSKYPELFRPVQEGNGDGGAGNRGRNGGNGADMNAAIRNRLRGN